MKSLMIYCLMIFCFPLLTAQVNDYTAEVEITDEAKADKGRTDGSISIFTKAEEYPKFPGGEKAMLAYIQANLQYPEIALSHGHEGTVMVEFVVEADGSVGQTKIRRTVGLGCDEAALAVFEDMPKWKPAYQSGTAIPVRYITPVKFSIY